MKQNFLFGEFNVTTKSKRYLPVLTVVQNSKGVIDADTVKGCELGMSAYPHGGCYGECYAYKTATRYGFDFSKSVSRKLVDREHTNTLTIIMQGFRAAWYRIGNAGDPCHDWNNTVVVCNALRYSGKIPVITTKHWIVLSDEQIFKLKELHAVFNTSTSGMDSADEIKHRVNQIERLKYFGLKSVCRVVTCNYGTSEWARRCKEKEQYLLSLGSIINTAFRATARNIHVANGDILLDRNAMAVGGGGKFVSINSDSVYLGTCEKCPDQCGVDSYMVANKPGEIIRWT